MGRIFDPENGFFSFISQIMDVVALSLLWLVCSLPLVTIGPATAALYYCVVKCVRRGENKVFANFKAAFRENLKTGMILTVILLPLAYLLLCGAWLMWLAAAGGDTFAGVMGGAYLLALFLPLGVLFIAFPLLSRFTYGVKDCLWTALQLTIRHFPSAILLVVINGTMIWVSLQFWLFFPFLLSPGVAALLSSLFLERIFKKYTPRQEGEEDQPWYLK